MSVVSIPEHSVNPERSVSPERSVNPDRSANPDRYVSPERSVNPERYVILSVAKDLFNVPQILRYAQDDMDV